MSSSPDISLMLNMSNRNTFTFNTSSALWGHAHGRKAVNRHADGAERGQSVPVAVRFARETRLQYEFECYPTAGVLHRGRVRGNDGLGVAHTRAWTNGSK